MKPTLDIFGIRIDSYVLMMILGVVLSLAHIFIVNRIQKSRKISNREIVFLCVFVLFGVSLGARLLFFVTMIPNIHSFQDVIKYLFKEGGLVFYGGFIGGVLFGLLYVKLYGHDPHDFMELIVPAIPLGHAIGRIGCYLAGCCYGQLTDAAHGVHFVTLSEGEYALPVQLYEAIFLFCLWIFLTAFYFLNNKKRPYQLTGLYLVAYAIWRFIIEFYRGDDIRGIAIFSTSQWIAIIMVAIGIFFLFGHPQKYRFFQKQEAWVMKRRKKEE